MPQENIITVFAHKEVRYSNIKSLFSCFSVLRLYQANLQCNGVRAMLYDSVVQYAPIGHSAEGDSVPNAYWLIFLR
jgi:hypothetical protein